MNVMKPISHKSYIMFPELPKLYSAGLTSAAGTAFFYFEQSPDSLPHVNVSHKEIQSCNFIFSIRQPNALSSDDFVRECAKGSRKIQLF